MARETLPAALTLMFGHEGGYSDDKNDTGNWYNGSLVGTKYGVTGKTLAAHRGKPVTAADVRALSAAEATTIYRKSYWTQSGGDLLPTGLDYAAFDFGVNSGPATAVKRLQKVVGAGQDGTVGDQTLDAINRYPGGLHELIRDYCNERLAYMRGLKTWDKHGRGWTIRVTGKDPKGQYKAQPGVVGNALRLAAGAKPVESKPVAGGKAAPSDVSLTETLKKPEAWGPLGGLLSASGAIVAGSGPLQWALAAALVIAVGYGVYRLVKRDRAEA